jgi:ATP-dependent Clp protease ATP-binding subunit ClpX
MTKLSVEDLKVHLPNPLETIEELDKYIIGQTHAKKILAVMLLNRALLRLARHGIIEINTTLQKANVLLIGPTGVGKTGLIRALEQISDIPISIFDITAVTGSGYIGLKVEDILTNHVVKCEDYIESNYDRLVENLKDSEGYLFDVITKDFLLKESVETGIIYLDEIDKIRARGGKSDHNNEDTFSDLVQNDLLKIIEEGDINLAPARSSRMRSNIKSVNTKDIIFICGGAFAGLDSIIEQRLLSKSSIGFHSDISIKNKATKDHIFEHVTTEDLHNYGFKEEFLGRLPLRGILTKLTKETLIKIILNSKNSIFLQYKEIFGVFGIDLQLDKNAIDSIAEAAIELKIGARSLKSIFGEILTEELCNIFLCKETKLVITKELVKKRLKKEWVNEI